MSNSTRIALVGTGVFAHNLCKVFTSGGCEVAFFVDEFRTEIFMDRPVYRAADLDDGRREEVAKYVVAISHPEYRQAAVTRLQEQGVAPDGIIPLTDDHVIPMLDLVFGKHGEEAAAHFCSPVCTSLTDLERHFFGRGWQQAENSLNPGKLTIAFCFFGRGGGFRRHLRGLIPRLKDRFNLLAIMDEELPDEGFDIPELYMGPDTVCRFGNPDLPDADLFITAHFIPCSPPHKPKVNFLHTSYDFILEPQWIVDRLENADPHYIFTSTRATFEWMQDMVHRRPLDGRVCLIPGGYTRLDDNLRYAEAFQGEVDSVIYAPTLSLNAVEHHELTYSSPHATAILQGLLNACPDKRVIFRPHPNDLALLRAGRDDALARPFIEALALCEGHDRCFLDGQQTFYMDSYNRSAVMVSDTSSTAYTYALSTCRPVVFFSPFDAQVREIFSDQSIFIRDRHEVGQVVGSIEEMSAAVRAMIGDLDSWQSKVRDYRQRMCFNPGRSEEYFVSNIDAFLEDRRHPDWYYVD